ncbi:SWIM zinc finger family protein [Kitasatospora sp. CMC57]|uniref:SWIM zinc finger family protein n=1 Tax=Kitasatospora sp. CMC57 TaxID=3231513 RepID=A0AB33K4T3_9ACTN
MTPDTGDSTLPPVAPDVLATAVEALTSRLRKKLDAAVEQYAALPVEPGEDGLTVRCGEDAVVTLAPGADGVIAEDGQARCSCLLAPRCLHRAALLHCCPLADSARAAVAAVEPSGDSAPAAVATPSEPTPPAAASDVQVKAADALWTAAAAVLAAGLPAAGAVPQAELLRAAHTARLADLHRAEAAALRVVRGLRSARARRDGHRLADLTAALRELLLTTALLRTGRGDAAMLGTVRRAYRAGGALRVHGVFREPVLTSTGYAGVVTHLLDQDGRWFSVADVRPGGPARARGAATAPVSVGAAALDHAQLSRGGLLISGATASADGRLGSGRGVKASPVPGSDWTSGPLAALFARPLARAAAERLGDGPLADPEDDSLLRQPVGCDLVVLGAVGDTVLAREAGTEGPVIRLAAAHPHPELAHIPNLGQLAAHPGTLVRVLGRIDPDRAATLRVLAVGPVPGSDTTLRLPAGWQGRADLGYDLLLGAHFPPPGELPQPPTVTDPLAESPLWRVRRLVELGVAGGRRAVAESARTGGARTDAAALARTGFHSAAALTTALAATADRRGRDVFGRLEDGGADEYATSWLAAAVHLTAAERELVRATWRGQDRR